MSMHSNLSPEMLGMLQLSTMTPSRAENLKSRAAAQMRCYLTTMIVPLDIDRRNTMAVDNKSQTEINSMVSELHMSA